jgi:hypothetical protein
MIKCHCAAWCRVKKNRAEAEALNLETQEADRRKLSYREMRLARKNRMAYEVRGLPTVYL